MFHVYPLLYDDSHEIPSLHLKQDAERELENVCCKYLAVLYNISTI